MIVEFSCDLSRQTIFAEGDEVQTIFGQRYGASAVAIPDLPIWTFSNPRLVTDTHRLLSLDAAVRESLVALLSSPKRTARFGQTIHRLDKSKFPLVWGPSIDTFLLCAALKTMNFEHVMSAVEVGCGSGFVGKYLLELLPQDCSIDLIDSDPNAIDCAREAVGPSRVCYHCEDAICFLAGRRYDLIVANPPYIPRPDGEDYGPFGGTRLLNFLIDHAEDFLSPEGRLIVVTSSITKSGAGLFVRNDNRKRRNIISMIAPLKVVSVLNDAEWLKYIDALAGIMRGLQEGYPFSHELRVEEVLCS